MIKSVKSLFPLCILQLREYLQHNGWIFYRYNSSSLIKTNNGFIAEKSQHLDSKSALSITKEEKEQNHTTDIEEKEVISFKKYLSFSNNITTPFYTQLPEFLFQYTQIHFFFFKFLSYSPSYKSLYLMFEVIRI